MKNNEKDLAGIFAVRFEKIGGLNIPPLSDLSYKDFARANIVSGNCFMNKKPRNPTRPSQRFETRIKKLLARNEQAVNPKKKRHIARVIEKLCRLYRRGLILGVQR